MLETGELAELLGVSDAAEVSAPAVAGGGALQIENRL
jgi:hypothetical protein